MAQSKACNKCKQVKPLDSYGLNKNFKNGRRNTCKECRKIESASYRARYPEKKKAQDKRNYELNGDRIRQRVSDYRLKNKIEINQWHKQYRDANKDLIAGYKLKWRKANPEKFMAGINLRRARLVNAKTYCVTAKDLRKIMSQPCIYCGDKSQQLEHIIPLSRGGSHGIGNLAGACETCNKSKGAKFFSEWRYGKLLADKLLNPTTNKAAKD